MLKELAYATIVFIAYHIRGLRVMLSRQNLWHLSFYIFLFIPLPLFSTSYFDSGHQEFKRALRDKGAFDFDKKEEIQRLLTYSYGGGREVIGDNEWEELEVESFLATVDRTQTLFGSWGLKEVTCPIKNQIDITLLQDCIEYLRNNPDSYEQLRAALDTIAQYESDLVNYYVPYCELHMDAQRLYYSFFGKTLNNSKYALEVGSLVDVAKYLFVGGISTFVQLGMNQFSDFLVKSDHDIYQQRPFLTKLLRLHSLEYDVLADPELRKKIYQPDGLLTRWNALAEGSFKDAQESFNAGFREFSQKWQPALKVVSYLAAATRTLTHDGFILYQIKQVYEGFSFLLKTQYKLQCSLVHVGKIFKAIDTIVTLAQSSDELSYWKPMVQLQEFVINCSDNMKQLQKYIESSSVCTQEGKLVYSRGELLLMHKLIKDVKMELIPLLRSIGFVDALVSIGTITHEWESKHMPVCRVAFVESPVASIDVSEFWLPLIKNKPVVNSLSLGFGKPNKLILTGPNGGGKSTIMKSLSYLVLLGQSWGIVPAHTARMTLFDTLVTSFLPREDIARQLSTFMAEKERMAFIEQSIATMNNDKKILVALDEPYRGTLEIESSNRVYAFGQNYATKDNTMLLLATHLELPTQLEKKYPHQFVNYQMAYQQVRSGFKRLFTLIKGAAHWWFHDADKRSAFIDNL